MTRRLMLHSNTVTSRKYKKTKQIHANSEPKKGFLKTKTKAKTIPIKSTQNLISKNILHTPTSQSEIEIHQLYTVSGKKSKPLNMIH